MDFSHIINKILTEKKIVVFPGFGALKAKYRPARVNKQQNKLEPPSGDLIFDSTAKYPDDTLAKQISEKEGITKEEAKKKVSEFIENIKKTVQAGNRFEIKKAGYFCKGMNDVVVFSAKPGVNFFPETFGFEPTGFFPIKQPEKNETKPVKTEKEPNKKPVLPIIIGIAVAAFIAFILIPQFTGILQPLKIDFTFLKINNDKPFLDSSEFSDVLDTLNYPGDDKKDTTKTIDDMLEVMTDKQTALSIDIEEDTTNTTATDEETQDEAEQESTYFIIAASFVTRKRAEVMEKHLQSKGYSTQIIEKDARFRVAIDSFSEKETALDKLTQVRKIKGNEKYWLLKI